MGRLTITPILCAGKALRLAHTLAAGGAIARTSALAGSSVYQAASQTFSLNLYKCLKIVPELCKLVKPKPQSMKSKKLRFPFIEHRVPSGHI